MLRLKRNVSDGSCEPIEALACNHEEADTRILLHAHHIAQSTATNIIIHIPDTDVLLTVIAASSGIPGSLYIRT